MFTRRLRLSAVMFVAAVFVSTGGRAWGIRFGLGQTKDELKLNYDVAVTDHSTGRVTIVFTLVDEGRLAPLDNVEFVIPSQKKNEDGSHWMDLVVSIDMSKTDDGKRVGRVHILKELAERAAIRLNTSRLDGKLVPLTFYVHMIPIAKHLKHASSPASPAAAPNAAGRREN